MTIKEKLQILISIENDIDLNNITFKKTNVWPFIRSCISDYNFKVVETKQVAQLNIKGKILDFFIQKKKELDHLKYAWANYQRISESAVISEKIKDRTDIVFLAKNIERSITSNGSTISKFADSFKSIVSPEYSVDIFEYNSVDEDSSASDPTVHSLESVIHKARFLSRLAIFVRITPFFNKNAFTEFKEILCLTVPSVSSKLSYVEERLYTLFHLKNEFEKILMKKRPKLVVLTCFYGDVSFAIILACKKLKIKTVELQHGQQGTYHRMYTHWPNIPVDGYEMIPDYFWMWGEESLERINKWVSKTNTHKAFVGGNPWLAYFLKELKSDIDENDIITKWEKRVLISLQVTFIPEFILKAIQNSPNICWMIRLHPRAMHEKQKLQDNLNNAGYTNVDFEYANSFNIYELFSFIDIQITFWSSVAYEALSFDVNTIIVHENGKEAMRNYIDKGIFQYAEDKERLLELITNSEKYFNKEEKKYIETDPTNIKSKVKEIIENKL